MDIDRYQSTASPDPKIWKARKATNEISALIKKIDAQLPECSNMKPVK